MRAFSCTLGERVFPRHPLSLFSIMRFYDQEFDFREPFDVDEMGFYITVAQVNFWLNDREGDPDPLNSEDFLEYYRRCCFYNLVYDMLDEDPTSGMFFWDPKKECISIAFPTDGPIAKKLDEYNDSRK